MGKKKIEKNAFSEKNALRLFTKATVDIINEELKNVNVDYLISDLYFKVENIQAKELLKQYEKQLILCKLDYERFKCGLHVFFMDMEKYIREHRLYEEFFQLVYTGYVSLCKRNIDRCILNSFFDLFVQQYSYFCGGTKSVVYGLSTKNKNGLLVINEIGKNLTEINYYIHGENTPEKVINLFRRYGYREVKDEFDISVIILNDQVVTNMLFMLSYFVTEENEWLYPEKYRDGTYFYRTNDVFYDKSKMYRIKERLKLRQSLLNSKVTANLRNCDEIVAVVMDEMIKDEQLILIYKIIFRDNTSTSGFYSVKDSVFYGMWKESSEPKMLHEPIENIVLQLYMLITCKLSEEERHSLLSFIEVRDLDKTETEVYPLVKFEVKQKIEPGTGNRDFNKDIYVQEMRNVDSFTRKLPTGQVASDEAKEMALNLGIDLQADRTFVREFRKLVYKKGAEQNE